MKNKQIALLLMLLPLILCSLKLIAQRVIPGETMAYTKGSATVTETGAAVYNVPITVAAGIGGLQPHLSITCNTQGGNGLLGMAFSLQGLSAITRTSRTWEQDHGVNPINGCPSNSVENAVNFNFLDQYALDGEKLRITYDTIPTIGWPTRDYGKPGTTYFTEQNNFNKIDLIDTLHGSPTFFRVSTKDGLIKEYGNSADSKILLKSNGQPISWLLNKVEDRNGNLIQYFYQNDQGSGEYYPVKISYSGNSRAHMLPMDSVVFRYEERADKSVNYYKGSIVTASKLLKEIDSYSKGKIVRRYALTYSYSSSSGNAILTILQEYGQNNTALRPTRIDWTDQYAQYYAGAVNAIDPAILNNSAQDRVIQSGDFNGDGFTDIIVLKPGTGELYVFLGNPTGVGFTPVPQAIPAASIKDHNIVLADLNADSRTDLFFINSANGDHKFYLADLKDNALKFIPQQLSTNDSLRFASMLRGDKGIAAIDQTNDGLADLMLYWKKDGKFINLDATYLFEGSGNYNNGKSPHDVLSVGKLAFKPMYPYLSSSPLPKALRDSSELFLADFDGNGYPDYFLYNRQTGRSAIISRYTESHYRTLPFYNEQLIDSLADNAKTPALDPVFPSLLKGDDATTLSFNDLNGDGLPDVFYYDKTSNILRVWLNKGNKSFEGPVPLSLDLAAQITSTGYKDIRLFDENLDGRPDICIVDPATGKHKTFLNKGNLVFTPSMYDIGTPDEVLKDGVIAVTGNFAPRSLRDYLTIDPATGKNTKWDNTSFLPDMVNGITEGYGHDHLSYGFEYATLLDASIYRRSAYYTTYPATEIQNTFKVATRLTAYDGIIGIPVSSLSYQYESAVVNLLGRGFRGFRVVKEFDSQKHIYNVKHYYRDTSANIYVGDPLNRMETVLENGNRVVSASDYTLDYIYFPRHVFGLSFYSFTKRNDSKSFEPNGAMANHTVTEQEVDDYGNVTKLTIDYGAGHKDILVNNFLNDSTRWILGRLLNSTLIKIVPGKPKAVKNSSFEYDDETGQLTKEITYAGLETNRQVVKQYQYDVFGNILQSDIISWNGTHSETRTTTSVYDATGKYLVKTIDAQGHASLFNFDPSIGKILSSTDANGLTTSYVYDDFARLKKKTDADGTWVSYDYKYSNPNISATFPLMYNYAIYRQSSGKTPTIEFYDNRDRLIGCEKTSFDGRAATLEKYYNALDLPEKESRWHFKAETPVYLSYRYDEIGRLISEDRPDGKADSIAYFVNKKVAYNAKKQTKTYLMNNRDQVIEVVDNIGNSIKYDYNSGGNLLSTTDPKHNSIVSEYDERGYKTKMIDPDIGTFYYEYNGFGELINQTDSKGDTIQMKYDLIGRLVQKKEKEGLTSWTYDMAPNGIGLLQSVKNYDNSGDSYSYDQFGRVTQSAKTIAGKTYPIQIKYDNLSRINSVIYPSGLQVNRIYNGSGFLKEVRRASDHFLYWQAVKVNALGLLQIQHQGTSVESEYYYNAYTSVLDSLRSQNSSSFLNRWHFTFDDIGNLTKRECLDLNKSENFEYDGLNRLTRSTVAGDTSIVIRYDELGNIIYKNDVGGYTYQSAGEGPHQLAGINVLPGKYIPSMHLNIQYASFGKVTSIKNGQDEILFSYGVDRQRNMARYYHNGALVKTKVYVDNLYEVEYAGTQRSETNYIEGSNGVTAAYVTAAGGGKSLFLFRDHLGSVSVVTDSTGKVLQRYNYDAWGNRRNENWAPITPGDPLIVTRGFTGHEHYDLFNIVDMNGRLYDPVIGRFLSGDPFIQDATDLEALNRFAYASNNPLSITDPSGYFLGFIGHWISSAGHAIGQAAGATVNFVKQNWKTIIVVAVAIGTTVLTGGTAGGFWATVLSGAAAGFTAGTTASLLNGQSLSSSLLGGVKGALIGALSAGLTYGVGSVAQGLSSNGELTLGSYGVKIAGHGIVQGEINVLNGGRFVHGFYSGAVTGGSSIFSSGASTQLERVAISAGVGGTTSAITGGNFANGAITGAYVQMFNDEAHELLAQQIDAAKAGVELIEQKSKEMGMEVMEADAKLTATGLDYAGKTFTAYVAAKQAYEGDYWGLSKTSTSFVITEVIIVPLALPVLATAAITIGTGVMVGGLVDTVQYNVEHPELMRQIRQNQTLFDKYGPKN